MAELLPGYPQVANLDDDLQPEILLTNVDGVSVIEHNGVVKYRDKRPNRMRLSMRRLGYGQQPFTTSTVMARRNMP